jgi:hypothetical protein
MESATLEEIDEVFARFEHGQVDGRAVLTPRVGLATPRRRIKS